LIKGIIFDLDGVIVDTAKHHFKAWSLVAKQLNIPFGEEQNEDLKGVSRVNSLEKILQWGDLEINQEKKQELLDYKNKIYLNLISKISSKDLLPGVYYLIETFRKNGYKIALGSASKNAIPILKKLELFDLFDEIVDGNLVSISKPDPEVFLKASSLLGVPKEKCLVFEDAQSGIQAAINAGMYCIAVENKGNLIGAHKKVNSLNEISDISVLINDLSDKNPKT
jgi:beta-phosphoglucomutase